MTVEKFMRRLLIRIGILCSILCTVYFFFWAVIWENWYWRKSLLMAVNDSWLNWFSMGIFVFLTAYFSSLDVKENETD